jgi:hypothetical protein
MSTHKISTVTGNVLAMLSLFGCLLFWTGFILFFFSVEAPFLPYISSFLFVMFRILIVATMLSAVATILRSKLGRFALPISAVTLLSTWYTIVSGYTMVSP